MKLRPFLPCAAVLAIGLLSAEAAPDLSNLKAASDNPILKTDAQGQPIFTADPAVLVDGDTLYLYAGQDEARIGGWFSMNRWVCYSTKDMVHWKPEGVPISATDFSWGSRGTAWACQVVKKNGKYYFYSTSGRPNKQGYTVGVAVSDQPTGPFVDVKKAPLFDNAITTARALDSIEDIDPTIFIDDDGKAYIYWGNGVLHYALLSDDMMSLRDLDGDGKITEGADVFSKVPIQGMQGAYGEAPWLYKEKGKYYLVYASGLPQKVRYAMSDSPRGPWKYQGVILDENLRPDGSRGDLSSDTSHPAVVTFKGQSYVFYHNAAQPTGGQTRRSVCVEKIAYNADGTIQTAAITSTGITGTASRLQSFRDQAQFVRFAGFDAKLEKPAADARPFEWELLRGLDASAPAGAVSIQCVSHPGYYLVVKNGAVALAKHDATDAFRKSATFRVAPGLSDKTWITLESFAEPKLVLRSSGADGKLTAEPLTAASPAADRQDATFKIQ